MQRLRPLVSLLLLVTCLLSATGAEADGPDTWKQRMDESDGLLRSADYAAAYEITDRLHREVGRSLVDGLLQYDGHVFPAGLSSRKR